MALLSQWDELVGDCRDEIEPSDVNPAARRDATFIRVRMVQDVTRFHSDGCCSFDVRRRVVAHEYRLGRYSGQTLEDCLKRSGIRFTRPVAAFAREHHGVDEITESEGGNLSPLNMRCSIRQHTDTPASPQH